MATVEKPSITVRQVPPGTMLAEAEREMRKYEVRYEMSSEKDGNSSRAGCDQSHRRGP